jgi:glycosyltransferase involved in cell wall biosynthesis
MKILICHNFYQSRGGEAETVFRDKKLLEKKGHSVTLFDRDNKEINNYGLIQKIKLFFDIFFSFKTYREIKRIIEQQRPDIAHIHNVFPLISPSVYYALKKMKIPVLQTIHNYRFLCPNGLFLNNKGKICERCKNGNFFHAIVGKCYRDSYLQTFGMAFTLCLHRKLKTFINKIDIFVSPSNFLKKKLIEGRVPKEKIVVKPHFIECEKAKPSYEFDNYVVYLGRLSREKGLFTLVKAFENIGNITLKIIGEGPTRKELERFVIQEGIKNVQFLGFIIGQEKFKILNKAMFMILPSECYENMPYAVLESFARGVPVIASKIGGLKELIEDGVTGFLFEPGNVEDLKQKIVKLLNDRELLLKIRYNVRKVVKEKYSEEIGYKNMIELYQKVITNNL